MSYNIDAGLAVCTAVKRKKKKKKKEKNFYDQKWTDVSSL